MARFEELRSNRRSGPRLDVQDPSANDPIGDYLRRGGTAPGEMPMPIVPGTQERFGDPTKIITQHLPPTLNAPMPRTAQNMSQPVTQTDASGGIPPIPEGWELDPGGTERTKLPEPSMAKPGMSDAAYNYMKGSLDYNVGQNADAATQAQYAAASRVRPTVMPVGGREVGPLSQGLIGTPPVGSDIVGALKSVFHTLPEAAQEEIRKMVRGPR